MPSASWTFSDVHLFCITICHSLKGLWVGLFPLVIVQGFQNLLKQWNSVVPLFCKIRWLHLFRVLNWITNIYFTVCFIDFFYFGMTYKFHTWTFSPMAFDPLFYHEDCSSCFLLFFYWIFLSFYCRSCFSSWFAPNNHCKQKFRSSQMLEYCLHDCISLLMCT